MELFLFDMDGVLIKGQAYHRALQETAKLVGNHLGLKNIYLTKNQIAQFQALGISSEWHSSALCQAKLHLDLITGKPPNLLDLSDLFWAISREPISISPRERGINAITTLSKKFSIDPSELVDVVAQSDSIDSSLTMNWFQELVLGSENFETIYQKQSQLNVESYLNRYDSPNLSRSNAEKILALAAKPDKGASIMTNRPSYGIANSAGLPDAGYGASQVGLESLPLIGYGEMTWLANETSREPGLVVKPNAPHALAAILAACSWPPNKSLLYAGQAQSDWNPTDFSFLHGGRINIFEDGPGGIIAVEAAGEQLANIGIHVEITKIGIAEDSFRASALLSLGAQVFDHVDRALLELLS